MSEKSQISGVRYFNITEAGRSATIQLQFKKDFVKFATKNNEKGVALAEYFLDVLSRESFSGF